MRSQPRVGVLWYFLFLASRVAGVEEAGEMVQLADDRGKPNNAPKQLHLKKGTTEEHMPGTPMTQVGYPKQHALKGGDKLHDDAAAQRPMPSVLAADDEVYPGGGKMSAEDVHELMQEVGPFLDQSAEAKQLEQKWEDQNLALHASKMKNLAASIREGVHGTELLSGALPQQLGSLRGNHANCMNKLLQCKQKTSHATSLGEDSSPEEVETYPKHTATEEDRMARGEEHPAAHIKAKPKTEHETKTATQDYVDSQSVGIWKKLPYQPGFKMKHDRMTNEELKKLISSIDANTKESKKLDKQEIQRTREQVRDANNKAVTAMTSVAKSASFMARARGMPKTAAVLKEMSDLSDKLKKCMADVKAKCQDTFRVAKPAVTLGSPLRQMPHPEDHPERFNVEEERPVPHKKHDSADTATNRMSTPGH